MTIKQSWQDNDLSKIIFLQRTRKRKDYIQKQYAIFWTKKGFKLNVIHVGRMFNDMQIGKYTNKCYVDKIRKGGFEYIRYIGK